MAPTTVQPEGQVPQCVRAQEQVPVWLWVHDLLDPAATVGAAMLSTRVPVLPLPLPVALASRWWLKVSGRGTALRLQTPAGNFVAAAGEDSTSSEGLPLAGVMHTHGAVELAATLTDRDYKAAEWQALLWAGLHGMPVPVLNRPLAAQVAGPASAGSPAAQRAWWCQRLARAGLPVWPAAAAGAPAPAAAHWGLMVTGSHVVQAEGVPVPGWPEAARRRLCALARAQGLDWLALAGAEDGNGRWRISGVSTRPDLRPFGAAGAAALAAWLHRRAGAATAH